jgi:hypothetical protein
VWLERLVVKNNTFIALELFQALETEKKNQKKKKIPTKDAFFTLITRSDRKIQGLARSRTKTKIHLDSSITISS